MNDARLLLQRELVRRCEKNSRYSLRAFAKALGLSHTVLSLVLNGKRPLSKKAALKICDQLELSPEERTSLLKKRQSSTSNTDSIILDSYQQITLDTFALLSDWYHYAILSLLEIPGSKFEAKFIARRIGITESEAKAAMERLQRLELVGLVSGRMRQTGASIKVENTISTSATRKFHRQLLTKALESLENDPAETRDFSSMTMAIDSKLIPYARERIRAFRRELTRELEAKGKAKSVYNLTVQIYPVTKEMKK